MDHSSKAKSKNYNYNEFLSTPVFSLLWHRESKIRGRIGEGVKKGGERVENEQGGKKRESTCLTFPNQEQEGFRFVIVCHSFVRVVILLEHY
jgi:hypothetical protein